MGWRMSSSMLCQTLVYVLWAFGTSLSGRPRMKVHFFISGLHAHSTIFWW